MAMATAPPLWKWKFFELKNRYDTLEKETLNLCQKYSTVSQKLDDLKAEREYVVVNIDPRHGVIDGMLLLEF